MQVQCIELIAQLPAGTGQQPGFQAGQVGGVLIDIRLGHIPHP